MSLDVAGLHYANSGYRAIDLVGALPGVGTDSHMPQVGFLPTKMPNWNAKAKNMIGPMTSNVMRSNQTGEYQVMPCAPFNGLGLTGFRNLAPAPVSETLGYRPGTGAFVGQPRGIDYDPRWPTTRPAFDLVSTNKQGI